MSSALTLNYSPAATVALQKSSVDGCSVSHWFVSLLASLTCRAAAGLQTPSCLIEHAEQPTEQAAAMISTISGTHQCDIYWEWYCAPSLSGSYHVQTLILTYFRLKKTSPFKALELIQWSLGGKHIFYIFHLAGMQRYLVVTTCGNQVAPT